MKSSSLIKSVLLTEIDPAFAVRAGLIMDTVIKKRSKKILDAGCGRGFYVKLLTLLKFPQKIIGVDIHKDYVRKAQILTRADKRTTIMQASIYSLPFPDSYFDTIICSEVLEHLTKESKAVHELFRVLKSGGTLIVTVPNKNFPMMWDPVNWFLMRLFNTHIPKHIWWLAGIWADHERLYTKREICILLNSKFKIINSKLIVRWCWPFTHFMLYGIGKKIIENYKPSQLNRFAVSADKPFARFLASCMRLPQRLRSSPRFDCSVNIFVTARKS